MNPIEHALIGWCIANVSPDLDRRERLLITAAAVIPDVDGLGMVAELATRGTEHPLFWWTDYHHVLAHNVGAAMVITIAAFVLARHRWTAALLACAAFHSHILGDVIGARGPDGYQWPIPYFLPFSRTPELAWSGQWALNAWQNLVITAAALLVTLMLARRRGVSPVELISPRADALVVAALRRDARR